MKPSIYNQFVDDGDKVIVFNGITEKFFEIKSTHLPVYKDLLSNCHLYGDEVKPFINRMYDEGFVVEDDMDELVRLEKKMTIWSREDQYYLMILPTYQCNLRCWYCVQDHENLWMSDEVFKRIKKRIVSKLNDPSIKSFHLSWFGGEPLLSFDKVVMMSSFAKDLACKLDKSFSCAITTNGILLDPHKIEILRQCGVDSYQITIDGKQSYHDAVRNLPNASSFDIILKNVDEIAKHTHCTLRFNYTHENLHPDAVIRDIDDRLSQGSRKNISFMPYKVWQEASQSISQEDIDRLYYKAQLIGLTPKLPRSGTCYADQKHFDCIFPDGRVEKCDNNPIATTKGTLTDNGDIIWEGGIPTSHIPVHKVEDTECSNCGYFPICGGPCEPKRNEMFKNYGKLICQYDDKDKYMRDIIRNIVKNSKQIKNVISQREEM